MTTASCRPLAPAARSCWRRVLQAGVIGLACLPALAADPPAVAAREAERLYRAGDTVQALQRLDRALADHPADPSLRFMRGVMLAGTQRETEAAEIFTALTREFPELPEPYNNLAVLRAAHGDLDGARALLEDALRRDPDYAAAQENLGDVLLRQAQRAYEAAASAPRPAAALQRKLQSVRAIETSTPSPAR